MEYKLPRQLLRTRRANHSSVDLNVLDGRLPVDISGFAWFMLPAGDCEDGDYSKAGAPILGGDGIILKLDFDHQGTVEYTQKFAVTESFLADKATWNKNSPNPEIPYSDKILFNIIKKSGQN